MSARVNTRRQPSVSNKWRREPTTASRPSRRHVRTIFSLSSEC
ncbi:hypothetical protein BN2537_14375 [Streptomyces venezuelae]|nr:hypothetical protein BN2537_14375 [Streptomyces venezuelae]